MELLFSALTGLNNVRNLSDSSTLRVQKLPRSAAFGRLMPIQRSATVWNHGGGVTFPCLRWKFTTIATWQSRLALSRSQGSWPPFAWRFAKPCHQTTVWAHAFAMLLFLSNVTILKVSNLVWNVYIYIITCSFVTKQGKNHRNIWSHQDHQVE